MVNRASTIPSFIVFLVWCVMVMFPLQSQTTAAQNDSFLGEEDTHTKLCAAGDDGKELCTTTPTREQSAVACENIDDESCSGWANSGECEAYPVYMLVKCAKACKMCGKSPDEVDQLIQEQTRVNKEKEQKEEQRVQSLIQNHGVVQLIPRNHSIMAEYGTWIWWTKTKTYMEEVVYKEKRYKSLEPGACQNLHENCTLWAARGECQKNYASWMTENCKPACRMCHTLIFEERCPYDGSQETNAWKQPGDLSKMFERIITEPSYQHLHGPIRVLSKPRAAAAAAAAGDGDRDDTLDGPWVITMDNFLSKEECERLIELGSNFGYKQSVVHTKVLGGYKGVKNQKQRTSASTWCSDDCYHDDTTQTILRRLEDLTGILDPYSENLQLLKYEVGQHYVKHHDYLENSQNHAEGVRILTVFLYLNDVPAGGETRFTVLNLTVTPKQGRVLIWPNVLDENPNEKDGRTEHAALVAKEGMKYGANAWYHQRDQKEVYSWGC